MKKFLGFSAVTVFFVAVMFGSLFSDENQARANIQSYFNNLSNKPLFSNLRITVSPVIFPLRQQSVKEISIRLEQGNRYVIFASGDNTTSDIDMYVMDAYGNVIARDDQTPAYNGGPGTDAGVVVRPFQTQMFKIQIKLYSGNGHVAYCVGTY